MNEERIYTPNPVIVALLLVCIFGSFFAVGYMLMDWMRENEREELSDTLRRWAKLARADAEYQSELDKVRPVKHDLKETPPPPPTLAPEVE